MHDPRIHAALVRAARSCPPLRREAYTGARIDQQLDDNVRQWLADARFNQFPTSRNTAHVSQIFNWYAPDFKAIGGVRLFIAQYAFPENAEVLRKPDTRIDYKEYHWDLNDATALGSYYGEANFYWDLEKYGLLWPLLKSRLNKINIPISLPGGLFLGILVAVYLFQRLALQKARQASN